MMLNDNCITSCVTIECVLYGIVQGWFERIFYLGIINRWKGRFRSNCLLIGFCFSSDRISKHDNRRREREGERERRSKRKRRDEEKKKECAWGTVLRPYKLITSVRSTNASYRQFFFFVCFRAIRRNGRRFCSSSLCLTNRSELKRFIWYSNSVHRICTSKNDQQYCVIAIAPDVHIQCH